MTNRKYYVVVVEKAEVLGSKGRYVRVEKFILSKMITKLVGQKYTSIAKSWIPTLAVWGAAGGVALVHFTDWRLFLDYVPYINNKFKKDE